MKKFKVISVIVALFLFSTIFIGCNANTKRQIVFIVDGQEYAKVNYDTDGQFDYPEEPTKKGYTFDCWHFDNKNKETLSRNSKLKGRVKVYASFKPIMVKLFVNGEFKEDAHILEVDNKKQSFDGLTFDGWYIDQECTKKYNNENVSSLYGTAVARVKITNGYEKLLDVLIKPGEKLAKPKMDANFLKPYMNENGYFEFNVNGEEFNFDEPIEKNTDIDLIWESKGLKCKPIANSEFYEVTEYPDFSSQEHPIISIPNKTYVDVGGNKVLKEVKSVKISKVQMWTQGVEKIVVNEGIKYICGINGFFVNGKLKEVVLPKKSLKIIEDSFFFVANDFKVEIPRSVEIIINSFWQSSPYLEGAPPSLSKVEYKIPNTVKTLSLVPTNLVFDEGSSFEKKDGMIFKKEGADNTLVSVGFEEYDELIIPEGVTHIQVGALCKTIGYKPFKTLRVPSTWKGVKYNGLASDYSGQNGEYQNPNMYLKTDNLDWDDLENHSQVFGESIIDSLKDIQMVDINLKGMPTGLGEYVICDLEVDSLAGTVEATKYSDHLDKIVFSAEVEAGSPVELNVFGESLYYKDRNPKAKIMINSHEKLTRERIRNELHLEANETIGVIRANGEVFSLDNEIIRNMIVIFEIGLTNTGFTYRTEGDELVITGFDETTALETTDGTYDIFIPKEIGGKKITKIASSAFKGEERLGKVFVAADVKEIGEESFKGCTNLKIVGIKSDNLKRIGKRAFEDSGLEHIILPLRNLEELGEYAFRCKNLKKFEVVEKEKATASLINPYAFFINKQNLFYSEPIIGKFYLMYFGSMKDGIPVKGVGGQLVRVTGKTKVAVKKNALTEETNLVDVYDLDFYAQATAAEFSDGDVIQLGITRRYAIPQYNNPDVPIFRYTLKRGAFNYIKNKGNTRLQFAVVKKVESGAFNDMDPKFINVTTAHNGTKITENISTFKPDEGQNREVDTWITKEDFKNEEIFEDGWWNNIKKTDPEYTNILEMIDAIQTENAIAIL